MPVSEIPKKYLKQKEKSLFSEIQSSSLDIGIGIVGPEEIDRLNILRATRLSMKLAVEDLSMSPDILIIDAVSLHVNPDKTTLTDKRRKRKRLGCSSIDNRKIYT